MNTLLIDSRLIEDIRRQVPSKPTEIPQDDCRLARMFIVALYEVSKHENFEFKKGKFALI
jgi:hypothetical protein